MEPRGALQEFATAFTTQSRFNAFLEMAKDRGFLHQAVNTPEFEQGLTTIATMAKEADEGYDRLLAVVTLSRLRAIVKSLRGRVDNELAVCLESPLSRPSLLSNPDDRLYLAQACRVAWHNWMLDYLAEASALEETAEKPRAEYIRSLLTHAPSLNDTLQRISNKLIDWTPDTEAPSDSAARRLRRIIAAVRPSIREYIGRVPIETGESVGNLIRTAFKTSGPPTKITLIKETTEEVAGLIHDLIRARFSLATERSTYDAMRVCASWFQPHRWPQFSKSSKNIKLVVGDLIEGISLLARQGITDSSLLACLSMLLGSGEAANSAIAQLAVSLTNLRSDIREWLASGGSPRLQPVRSELAEESQTNVENTILANLLVDTERYIMLAHIIETDVIPEAQMLSPKMAEQVGKFVGHGKALGDAVHAFASSRQLRTREHPDAVVEYSPLDHELVGGARQGVRKVRVIRPVVERVGKDAVPFVVRKGLVEEI